MGTRSNLKAFGCVAVLAAAAIAFIYVTSASFPDGGATHFDVRGQPDAAMSRNGYRGFMAFLVVVIPLLIAGLPTLFARRWPMLLNIPNREHWLAPERIEATLASIQARSALLACGSIVLVSYVHLLVMAANAGDRPELDPRGLLIGLGVFVAFMFAWIFSLWRRFKPTDGRP